MKKKFTVDGMYCQACSLRVEKTALKVDGVKSASVNLLASTLLVEIDNTNCIEKIKSSLLEEGYALLPYSNDINKQIKQERKDLKRRFLISVPFVLLLTYITMGGMINLPLTGLVKKNYLIFAFTQIILCLPPLIVNYKYFVRGFSKLFKLAPNMDSLVSLGSSVSFVYSLIVVIFAIFNKNLYSSSLYFESSCMIVTLITFGKFLEAHSKLKTTKALTSLIELSPPKAILLKDGKEVEIKTELINEGDLIVVKAGQIIAVDGIVTQGYGSVNQSMLTGESLPVPKEKENEVIGGTVLVDGYLVVKATKVGEDSYLNQIIKLVEDANSSKAPISKLADKVSAVFVPIVMILSLLGFAFWLIIGKGLAFAINVAVSVLVISCPCALGLATPVAIMVATGKSAESGILIKSGETLQVLGSVDSIAVDKTGTLTYGEPKLDEIIPYNMEKQEILKIAYSLELKSEHVLSKAITNYAITNNIESYNVEDYKTYVGKGLSGIVKNHKYYLGSINFANEILKNANLNADEILQKANTCMVLFDDVSVLGVLTVTDNLRETTVEAIKLLKQKNIDITMITGDNKKTAQLIADKLGINYFAEVLPECKNEKVIELKNLGKKVAFVGDGINDAPAIAVADVGIAIGCGSNVAIENADVVLVKNNLRDVSYAIDLSKKTLQVIKQNLFWAFFYNSICIPIALGVLFPLGITLNPIFASLSMGLSSLCVVLNSLRLNAYSS